MGLFSKPKKRSIVLVDIGSASVGGAYAHFEPNMPPAIYYTARVPIEKRPEEPADDAMVRSLTVLADILIKHGAPTLREETGSAHIDGIVASIASPWQETTIRVESKQEEKPYLFTHDLLKEMAARNTKDHPERIETGESVIATILNGYDIQNPFGKRVKRADIVILSSTIDKQVAEKVEKALRRAYHAHEITMTAFAPLSYAVMRDLYPHEKDFLILDVAGESTELAFVKRGLLTDIASIAQGTNALIDAIAKVHTRLTHNGKVIDTERNAQFADFVSETEKDWLCGLVEALKGFSSRHALPRTLFLLADANARGYLERLLDNPELHSIWLSDEPLSIISVSPKHMSQYLRTRGKAEGDMYLAMMALFYNKMLLGD